MVATLGPALHTWRRGALGAGVAAPSHRLDTGPAPGATCLANRCSPGTCPRAGAGAILLSPANRLCLARALGARHLPSMTHCWSLGYSGHSNTIICQPETCESYKSIVLKNRQHSEVLCRAVLPGARHSRQRHLSCLHFGPALETPNCVVLSKRSCFWNTTHPYQI
jgi:hypothetical protein